MADLEAELARFEAELAGLEEEVVDGENAGEAAPVAEEPARDPSSEAGGRGGPRGAGVEAGGAPRAPHPGAPLPADAPRADGATPAPPSRPRSATISAKPVRAERPAAAAGERVNGAEEPGEAVGGSTADRLAGPPQGRPQATRPDATTRDRSRAESQFAGDPPAPAGPAATLADQLAGPSAAAAAAAAAAGGGAGASGAGGTAAAAGGAAGGAERGPQHKVAYVREAGGERWKDASLAEWPEGDFRIFVGNLGNEVSDNALASAFQRYPSFNRAKVVRASGGAKAGKSKGYGFVSLQDPADGAKALREMQGKYVGNRPIQVKRSSWADRGVADRRGRLAKTELRPAEEEKLAKRRKLTAELAARNNGPAVRGGRGGARGGWSRH